MLERNSAKPIPKYNTERYCFGKEELRRVIPIVTITMIMR